MPKCVYPHEHQDSHASLGLIAPLTSNSGVEHADADVGEVGDEEAPLAFDDLGGGVPLDPVQAGNAPAGASARPTAMVSGKNGRLGHMTGLMSRGLWKQRYGRHAQHIHSFTRLTETLRKCYPIAAKPGLCPTPVTVHGKLSSV